MSNLHRERRQPYNVRILNYFLDHKDKIDKSQLSHLMSIQDKTIGLNEFPTKYGFKLDKNGKDCSIAKLGYGRIYGDCGSSEYLDYNYRNNLYGDTEHDIDMKNCHPTLLSQLARKKGFTCTQLEEYVRNREEYLEQIIQFYAALGTSYTRRDAKNTIIALMYGAEIPAFKSLQNELDVLTTLLKDEHQILYSVIDRLKQKNKNGTFLSYIAQTEERHCLDAIDSFFLQQGRSVDGLAYDGLMVRKLTKDEVFPIELLRKAEQFVQEKTGYKIVLEIKPMVRDIDDSVLKSKSETLEETYAELKKTFELNHFYFEPANTVVRIDKGSSSFHFALDHARLALNALKLQTPKGEVPFINKWIPDSNRRTIRRFVAKMPEECEVDEMSLFKGFAYKKLKVNPTESQRSSAISLFQDLVRASSGDEEVVFQYLIRSMARMIQHPLIKSNVLIAFATPLEGTGKDTVMLILKWIIGEDHTAHYTDTDTFWEKHNTDREGAILVYLEEACAHLNKAKDGQLKALVTSDKINLNPKNTKPYSVPNLCNIWMTTNETEPFKVGEHNRRGMLITPSARLINEDWVSIYAQIQTPFFLKAIGEYLESIDLTDFNPTKFPETRVKKEMKELAKSSEKVFFEQWTLPQEEGKSVEWVTASDLFKQYRSYCSEHDLPHALNTISFCKRIIHLVNVAFKRRIIDGKNMYAPLSVQE